MCALTAEMMHYHCLHVRINSGGDVVILCKNLENFCLVTPEIMALICVPRYMYFVKIGPVDSEIIILREITKKEKKKKKTRKMHGKA